MPEAERAGRLGPWEGSLGGDRMGKVLPGSCFFSLPVCVYAWLTAGVRGSPPGAQHAGVYASFPQPPADGLRELELVQPLPEKQEGGRSLPQAAGRPTAFPCACLSPLCSVTEVPAGDSWGLRPCLPALAPRVLTGAVEWG